MTVHNNTRREMQLQKGLTNQIMKFKIMLNVTCEPISFWILGHFSMRTVCVCVVCITAKVIMLSCLGMPNGLSVLLTHSKVIWLAKRRHTPLPLYPPVCFHPSHPFTLFFVLCHFHHTVSFSLP